MTLAFDSDGAREIERLYSTPDIVRQRAEVLALLAPRPGERILDVGSGPGFLLEDLAAAVGPDGAAHGIDPSPAMNALAARRAGALPAVTLALGTAESLPYPDGDLDAVVSTQVYEYVPDIPRAFAELRRVVRPGGRVLLLDTDWDSVVWHVADRDRHARVMAAWEEHLVHPHLPATWARRLADAGFRVTAQTAIPILNPRFDENSYSALIARTIAAYVANRGGLTAADGEAWLADVRGGDYFFSMNRFCVLAEPE
ncbi:methyltransferase domain-containing protein [Pseudonocardia sp. RS11V-5]|uniref:methyltransferase domain-containing protein n=1 Tax=Pseudonocardia terrae TaxID=2905831 RepID=UPI001E32AD61|nr:methyltransferase domain-containing protein [Pseudonocardia terrae]MCE3552050.1 methyltransferase domain-containing protein [Pseudonocardia terrae]